VPENSVYKGSLCFGGFEPGRGIYWAVYRQPKLHCHADEWLLYRTANAVTLMGSYTTPEAAFAEYTNHVPPLPPEADLEASLGG
jgi:hypothetical protein